MNMTKHPSRKDCYTYGGGHLKCLVQLSQIKFGKFFCLQLKLLLLTVEFFFLQSVKVFIKRALSHGKQKLKHK